MFPSLDLMVQHYYRKSLKDHNPQLDTFLKYPVGYYLNNSSEVVGDDGELMMIKDMSEVIDSANASVSVASTTSGELGGDE